jgi:hypothetical protein
MVPSQKKPFAERFPQAVYWLNLRLRPKAAKALVQAGCLTLADLADKSREEMLAIPGVGKGSLGALEEGRGRRFPPRRHSFRPRRRSRMGARRKPTATGDPGANYWLDLGLSNKAAKVLARAGFQSVDDLQGKARQDLLAVPGVGEETLAHCERRLGLRFATPVQELLDRGIPLQVANGLVRAGFDSYEKVERLTREQFLAHPGLGEKGMRQLETVLGRQLDSPVGELCAQGLTRATAYRLSSAGVRRLEELANRPDFGLRSLGLTPGDVEDCRRLLRKPKEGSR